MSKLLDSILKIAKMEEKEDMDLKALRATRVPSKLKREMRRKYAKKHSRSI